MTQAPASAPVPACEAFDAALVRGQAVMAEPLPVLPKLEPERSAGRLVADLRGGLVSRFAYAGPVARAKALHRKSVEDLVQLERQLRWRRRRVAVAGFLMRYWLVILGVVVAVALVAFAITYREAIIGSVKRFWPAASTPAVPSSQPPRAGPSGTVQPTSPTGTTP